MKVKAKFIKISVGTVVLMAAIVAPIGGLNTSGALNSVIKGGEFLSPRQMSKESTISKINAIKNASRTQKVAHDQLTASKNANDGFPSTFAPGSSLASEKLIVPARNDYGGNKSGNGIFASLDNGWTSGSNYEGWRHNDRSTHSHHGKNGYLPGNNGNVTGNNGNGCGGNGGTPVIPSVTSGGDGTTDGGDIIPGDGDNVVAVPVPSAVMLGLGGLFCLSRWRRGILRTC